MNKVYILFGDERQILGVFDNIDDAKARLALWRKIDPILYYWITVEEWDTNTDPNSEFVQVGIEVDRGK